MQSPKATRWIAGASAAGVLTALIALVPFSAAAAPGSAIVFQSPSPMTADFGDNWSITLLVTGDDGYSGPVALGPTYGTVDVYLSGIGGAYASALPIQLDGSVYFAQPADKPLLGAGTYDVTAIYNPGSGIGYASSQTVTPLSLTISPIGLTPAVEVSVDPAVSDYPVITAELSGDYVEKTGGAPSGTWSFTLTDAADTVVFESEVGQEPGGTEPVRVELTTKLDKGATYTLSSTFVPVAELAQGISVDEIASTTYTTPNGSLVDALTTPVPLSLWLVVLMLLIPIGLAVTAIVLGVKLTNRSPREKTPKAKAVAGIPGDPENVELISWEEAGIHDEETKALPTTWSLGGIEPVDAPTEVLPTDSIPPTGLVDSAEVLEPAEDADSSEAGSEK